ncbi:hypothetical protein [Clostridium algidicarnis]|uniref:hypothetical protein n=1 Tax=Clostridium algidicarnis TaxID=37659 RepID=UPI00209ABA1B|nr:hypothetical protein [Clostridium algidicarnis]
MDSNENVEVALVTNIEKVANPNIEQIIYDLDNQIQMISSQADKLDYLVSISSGILCGMIDMLWVGDFDLAAGRDIADEKVNGFVKKTAKLIGCEDNDVKSCVAFLEKKISCSSRWEHSRFRGWIATSFKGFRSSPNYCRFDVFITYAVY